MGKSVMQKLVFILIVFCLSGCYAPVRQPQQSELPSIDATLQFPKGIVVRGQKYDFSISTAPSANCYLGFRYLNDADKWVTKELPAAHSDNKGNCGWTWEIPIDIKPGYVEVRAYVALGDQNKYLIPVTLCVERCE